MDWPQRWRHCDRAVLRDLFTEQHSVTYQKTCIFTYSSLSTYDFDLQISRILYLWAYFGISLMFWILPPYNNDNNIIPLHTKCKLKLHWNPHSMHNDICTADVSFWYYFTFLCILLWRHAWWCRMVETYSMIMRIWVFDGKYAVVLDCCWVLTV